MAVSTKFGAYLSTTGAAFVKQVVGGVVRGVSASGPITKGMSLVDVLLRNDANKADARPRERVSTGIYRAVKITNSGVFNYNPAKLGTWVISKVGSTLAGLPSTKMLFMSQANGGVRAIHEFQHDFGVRVLSAWVNGRFSWTGRLANGNPKNSRIMWLNAAGTAVQAPATLSTTFMFDLRDGNASDKAVDDAANPTRLVPGELIVRSDFVTVGVTGGNFLKYKPITGM